MSFLCATVLAEQEAARFKEQFSDVTDDRANEQSLTLFSPNFSPLVLL